MSFATASAIEQAGEGKQPEKDAAGNGAAGNGAESEKSDSEAQQGGATA